MLNEKALLEFVKLYYADKDIMHNMWHIELVRKMVDKILSISKNYIQWIRKKSRSRKNNLSSRRRLYIQRAR